MAYYETRVHVYAFSFCVLPKTKKASPSKVCNTGFGWYCDAKSGILSHHPHAGTNRRYILNVYNERCILRNALLALRKLTNVSKERNSIQEARGLPCLCFCLSSVHYTVMGTGLERQTIALFTLGAELYPASN